MKVRVYIEPPTTAIGGVEQIAVTLAGIFVPAHDVEIVHHKPKMTREQLEQIFAMDLSRVAMRYVPHEEFGSSGLNLIARARAAADWRRGISEGADLFVAVVHSVPPFCHAPVGAVIVAFPFYVRPRMPPGVSGLRWLKARIGLRYEAVEWRRRMAGYQIKASISEFVRVWVRRYWDEDSVILYPPVELGSPLDKQDLILSVGRFTAGKHSKRQRELMQAYAASSLANRYKYVQAGGAGKDAGDQEYIQAVSALTPGTRAEIALDIPRDRLNELYGHAKIFWHAAGFGAEPDAQPHLLEHFGITTVEAMSAGCVPVVIRRGGQAEIVEHGRSGFVWDTLDELIGYTERLTKEPDLWAAMSAAARTRAKTFSREAVVATFRKELRKTGVPWLAQL